MAPTTVHVRTVHEAPTAVGWAGHRTLTIDRPEQAGGMGLGLQRRGIALPGPRRLLL
jgi:hypothetical protein